MRYERLRDILRLATLLRARRSGMTLDDIRREFAVSRRTAERMLDAVKHTFGPLDDAREEKKRYWTLSSDAMRGVIRVSPEEVTELASAAEALDRAGLAERATLLRTLADKARATLPLLELRRLETDLEALTEAEGLAMRPGPRPRLAEGLLATLREAIKACRVVSFRYRAPSGGPRYRRRVRPCGLLYGNRAFLAGRAVRSRDVRLWRLANIDDLTITDEAFERDPRFDLRRYAARSFGVFQETPIDVVLRFNATAAPDATTFLFHPTQTIVTHPDGSLTVRFNAGGINEICWHLITWGDSVVVEHPAGLRRSLARMCATLAKHHSAR